MGSRIATALDIMNQTAAISGASWQRGRGQGAGGRGHGPLCFQNLMDFQKNHCFVGNFPDLGNSQTFSNMN